MTQELVELRSLKPGEVFNYPVLDKRPYFKLSGINGGGTVNVVSLYDFNTQWMFQNTLVEKTGRKMVSRKR